MSMKCPLCNCHTLTNGWVNEGRCLWCDALSHEQRDVLYGRQRGV